MWTMTAATAQPAFQVAVRGGTEQPFPYDNPVVGLAYHSLALELANAIAAMDTPYFKARVTDYLAARRTFKGLLKIQRTARGWHHPSPLASYVAADRAAQQLRHAWLRRSAARARVAAARRFADSPQSLRFASSAGYS